jgi:hypothetical protein
MRVPPVEELLRIWELGQDESPARRALRLLAAAAPEAGESGAARLSLGRRDACLLRLRSDMFGQTLECRVPCPQCGERLEFSLQAPDLIPTTPVESAEPLRVELAGCAVTARLPTAGDLAALGTEATARDLLERCVIDVRRDGEASDAQGVEDDLVRALEERMLEGDPLAQLGLDLKCPTCGHGWSQGFDILAYFWVELEAWARRTLLEVHTLASAYGWTQHEVLRLGSRRRQVYLELAGS